MPVTYRIHRDIGLVHISYTGFAVLDDSFAAIGRYMRDPDFRPGQKQLVDLSGVTGYEKDFAKLMALQARKVEAFSDGPASLAVYYAPTEPGLSMARLIARSWRELGVIVAVVHDDEAEAMGLLGLPETSLDALENRLA